MCKFYTDKTKDLLNKYDIEKLDDISDCILILLYAN